MKIGFLGMGNMAQAMCQGFIQSDAADSADIYAYAPHRDKLAANAERLGFTACGSLRELAERTDMLFICCKPYQIEDALTEIGSALRNKALVSVASGWSLDRYMTLLSKISSEQEGCEGLASAVRVQAIMPNTPVMVGEGVFLIEADNTLNEDEREALISMLKPLGLVHELPSSLMGIGGAVTGCFPAFADLFMEAYADAAVKYGISRQDAYALVSQALLGSAMLQQKTGAHPGVLKDQVCSPAGTTIRGVQALEDCGLRSACMASIDAIMDMKK